MPDINDAVIQALYAAAAGMETWKVALSGLHDAMQVSATQVFVIDKKNGQMTMHENSPQSPIEPMLDYVREYHRIDPHIAHASALPVAEVFNSQNLFPAQVYGSHPYFLEQWTGHNVRAILGAKAAEDERHVAMVGVTRGLDLAAYSADDMNLMRRYVGHLAVAFQIGKYLSRVQTHAIVGLGLMQASSRPMVLLDKNCGILAANDLANILISQGDPFQQKDDLLFCSDQRNEKELVGAVASLGLTEPTTSGRLRRIALRLALADGTSALCSLWDLRPEFTMGFFGTYPAALLTVAAASVGRDVDPMWLASLFDFTPAEVRIAIALMRGDDLNHIAAAQPVSIETVRSQLKSMFAKTSTHRQAQLVELLLRATAI